MTRRGFNPGNARGSTTPPPPAADLFGGGGRKPLTVTQAANVIREALEQNIPAPLQVSGEVSNLSKRNHWYFSLKDASSVLACVAWQSSIKRFKVMPADGQQVVATGTIGHYGPQGRTQFYITQIEQVGVGSLDQQFRALCAELRAGGYFEDTRKKPLPILPRKIAVVTAGDGAAVQDVIRTTADRCPAVGLVIVNVRVQGDGAAAEVAAAVQRVDAQREAMGVDAILITRGGGSLEDLWAFNDRRVADAVFHCTLPVVAAVGHESDTTIAELVADRRASTPTQAAMLLTPDRAGLLQHLQHCERRLQLLTLQVVERAQSRLQVVMQHPVFADRAAVVQLATQRLADRHAALRHAVRQHITRARIVLERLTARHAAHQPRKQVYQHSRHLISLRRRLHNTTLHRVATARNHLDGLTRTVNSLDPQRVVERGYSITFAADGCVVRRVEDVQAGDRLRTRLADGEIKSDVVDERESNRTRSRPRSPGDAPLDLFGGLQ